VDVRINERAVITIFESATDKHPKWKSDKAYLGYIGTLSDEHYDEIMKILEDTGKIDVNEW